MAREIGYYRTDSGARYSGVTDDRTRALRASSGRRNNYGPNNNLAEVSISLSPSKLVAGFICRYVRFKVIEPPYPGMIAGGYHRMIIFRDTAFAEFAADMTVWTWNGVDVRPLSVHQEVKRYP